MIENKKILVVDDEEKILEVISSYLTSKGCFVYAAQTGQKGLEIFQKETIDFVILDLMLPDTTGEEICMEIRKTSRVPIIMLTAKSMEEDMLYGLKLGADDYITKPFSLKELYARIEVIIRRTSQNPVPLASKFSWRENDLVVNCERMEVYKKGELVNLTPKEWKVLHTLLTFPKKVFSREELIAIGFDVGFDGYDRVIDTHIKNLRNKIEDNPKKPIYIQTVHGIGYRFGGKDT